MVVSRTRDSSLRTSDLPADFVLEEVRLVVLAPLAEDANWPDARPSAVVGLLLVGLGAPEAGSVEEDVTAVVVSAVDCAVGRQAIASADTISVVEIPRVFIFRSWNSHR